MAVFKSLSGYYIKGRPKAHRMEGITTRQHAGFVLSRLPKDYPITAPQRRVRDAAAACGIKTGMSRAALVTAMKDCIPSKLRRGG
ncbi:hypothetical protein LCGC14_3122980 [marine sediment metagenome]|uniref:Uncharacterized protein n=1 Tax=marine sediment metagenome TaxID=412755 RepID=A0A0F8Y962_9ZZZZ